MPRANAGAMTDHHDTRLFRLFRRQMNELTEELGKPIEMQRRRLDELPKRFHR